MMKLKTVVLSTSLAVPALVGAQNVLTGSDAQGYFERGKLMYESHNYTGAIDQMKRVKELPSSATLREQADYYMALSRLERDEAGALNALRAFTGNYPTSELMPDVLMRIGNLHFYHGEYGDALTSYSQVRERALDGDMNEDLIYRMAYCNLQLEQYAEARYLYETLKGTRRYDNATRFYNAYIDYANKHYDAAYAKFSDIDRAGELGYQSQYYMCQIDFNHKDYDRVISLGETLLSDEVNDYFAPEIHRLVGESYYHKDKVTKAREHLNKYVATTQDPLMRSASYALGVMDFDSADYTNAVQHLSQVTDVADDMAQSAYFYIGQSQLKLGESKLAALAFEKSSSMDFDREVKENAYYNYAVCQSKGSTTPFGNDIELFENFLNEFPYSTYKSAVEKHLVQLYYTTNNYERALTSIENIKNPSPTILKAKQNVLYNLGVKSMQKGYRKEAANYLKKAIKVGNYDKKILNESRLWLAETQYIGGDYESTVNNLKEYVKDADKTDANYGKALYNLGYAQYQQKNFEEARKNFELALASGTLDSTLTSDTHDRIADTYYYAGDFKNAESQYEKAIETTSGAADGSMFDKAMMAGWMKDYPSKIKQMHDLIEKYPESTKVPTALLEIARSYEAMGKIKEATAQYKALGEKYPKQAEARQGMLHLALIQKNLGNQEQAIEAYKRVITDAPTSEEAKVAADDLKSMYAEREELNKYVEFIATVPNAPQLEVSDIDRLTFEAAEKAATATHPSILKMEKYLQDYPTGANVAAAKYYIGRYHYEKGNLTQAFAQINEALTYGEDAIWAEDALVMKSDILVRQGKQDEAIKVYEQIIERTKDNDSKVVAQMGLMRAATDIKRFDEVIATADNLLQNSSLTADEINEVKLGRAVGYIGKKDFDTAETDLKVLATDMSTEHGARAAWELARLQMERGNYKGAEDQIDALLDSGTPQTYWIGRAYILLSDVLVKEGKPNAAREYLESLKNNYPGKEKDIFNDIESRLKSINKPKVVTRSKKR